MNGFKNTSLNNLIASSILNHIVSKVLACLNMADSSKFNNIFILTDKGEFIQGEKIDKDFKASLKDLYNNELKRPGKDSSDVNFFKGKINGTTYLITYVPVENAGWSLIEVQLYDEVFQEAKDLQLTIIIITAIFLILAFVASLPVSKKIYKPIDTLIKTIAKEQPERADTFSGKDEIGFLQGMYKQVNEALLMYEREKDTNNEIIKSYFLRRLVVESFSISDEEIAKASAQEIFNMNLNQHMLICLIKLDNYSEFNDKYSIRDKDLIKYAIMNILTQVLSYNYENTAIDMKDDQIIVLLGIENHEDSLYENLIEHLKQAQTIIFSDLNISVSISVSQPVNHFKEITKSYSYVLNISMYRLIYGKRSIITHEMIKNNQNNTQFKYPFSLEKELIKAIKSGNSAGAEEVLSKILHDISNKNYTNIMLSLTYVVNIIRNTVDEMNQLRIEPILINSNLLNQEIYEFETFNELKNKFVQIFKEICGLEKTAGSEKHEILVDAVKGIIHANYFDNGLYLQQIAAMLKMSPTHIGRVFKEVTGLSVPEYINEIRLTKAVDLLTTSSLSINQVMTKIGVENESYFYKLFKKKFGTTPKEYVIKKALSSL